LVLSLESTIKTAGDGRNKVKRIANVEQKREGGDVENRLYNTDLDALDCRASLAMTGGVKYIFFGTFFF